MAVAEAAADSAVLAAAIRAAEEHPAAGRDARHDTYMDELKELVDKAGRTLIRTAWSRWCSMARARPAITTPIFPI